MITEKDRVLADAPLHLNKPDQPWEVTVEGDSIVARWKWMDALFFAPGVVSGEIRDFTFTVTLKGNGVWEEVDGSSKRSVAASNGGMKFSVSKFAGMSWKKSIQIGLGKDNRTGEAGVVGFSMDTATIKEPVRDYLTACGWKKAGVFEEIRLKMKQWMGGD